MWKHEALRAVSNALIITFFLFLFFFLIIKEECSYYFFGNGHTVQLMKTFKTPKSLVRLT